MAEELLDIASKPGNHDVGTPDDGMTATDANASELADMNDVEMDADNENGEEEEEEEEEDPFLKFQNVIANINFDKLKNLALEVRKQQPHPQNFNPSDLSCEVVEPPRCGSFNLVYVLEFSDDVKWVARFPVQGTRIQDSGIDKMNTDYSSLRYIRKAYGIPTPEVYTWETTCESVGVPFALMSFVTGESVCYRWLDRDWITEEKKLKILTNLAHIMARLQQPKFNKIGTLRFSSENKFSHIGCDHQVIEDEETFHTDGTMQVNMTGPYNNLEEWLDFNDPYEDVPESARWGKGCLEVMKLALESVPPYLRRSDRCEIDFFDYNYQNILIDDNCNITAIFDWDGIRSAPQGIGCTRYPSWITRDWDPGSYDPPEDGNWDASDEDSPKQLSGYRKHYADVFASLELKDYDPRQTRLSHILEAITTGITERFPRQYIMKILLDHAYGECSWPWKYPEITRTMMDPSTPAAKVMRKKILKEFKTMWHAEWETQERVLTKRKRQGPLRYLPQRRSQKQDDLDEESSARKKARWSLGYGRSISQYLSSKLAKLKT